MGPYTLHDMITLYLCAMAPLGLVLANTLDILMGLVSGSECRVPARQSAPTAFQEAGGGGRRAPDFSNCLINVIFIYRHLHCDCLGLTRVTLLSCLNI